MDSKTFMRGTFHVHFTLIVSLIVSTSACTKKSDSNPSTESTSVVTSETAGASPNPLQSTTVEIPSESEAKNAIEKTLSENPNQATENESNSQVIGTWRFYDGESSIEYTDFTRKNSYATSAIVVEWIEINKSEITIHTQCSGDVLRYSHSHLPIGSYLTTTTKIPYQFDPTKNILEIPSFKQEESSIETTTSSNDEISTLVVQKCSTKFSSGKFRVARSKFTDDIDQLNLRGVEPNTQSEIFLYSENFNEFSKTPVQPPLFTLLPGEITSTENQIPIKKEVFKPSDFSKPLVKEDKQLSVNYFEKKDLGYEIKWVQMDTNQDWIRTTVLSFEYGYLRVNTECSFSDETQILQESMGTYDLFEDKSFTFTYDPTPFDSVEKSTSSSSGPTVKHSCPLKKFFNMVMYSYRIKDNQLYIGYLNDSSEFIELFRFTQWKRSIAD